MARIPKYAQLGLTRRGNGYVTSEGKYISERQYRIMVGTPAKGSPGHRERMAEKAAGTIDRAAGTGKERRTFDQAFSGIKDYLRKNRGATERQAISGKEPQMSPFEKQTREAHNKAVNAHRREVLHSKEKYGLIDERTANSLKATVELEKSYREKLGRLRDRLSEHPDMPKGQRDRLKQEYDTYRARLDKIKERLDKAGVLPPEGSDYRDGYYH